MASSRGATTRAARAVIAAALGTAVTVAPLAACGRSGSAGSGGGAGPPGHDAAVLGRFVACVRAHGVPGFPDGSVDARGVVSFPAAAPRIPDSAANACRPLLEQLPPQPTSSPPVPQALFQQLLSLARCMRSHGVADWPDPAPSGTFFLDARLVAAGKRGVYRPLQACERAVPGVSGHFSVAQGG